MLWDALRRTGGRGTVGGADQAIRDSLAEGWRQGTLTHLLNPKV